MSNGGNRAKILAKSYGLGDESVGKAILNYRVMVPPTDPGDLKLQWGGKNPFTIDDAMEMWGYFEKDFNK